MSQPMLRSVLRATRAVAGQRINAVPKTVIDFRRTTSAATLNFHYRSLHSPHGCRSAPSQSGHFRLPYLSDSLFFSEQRFRDSNTTVTYQHAKCPSLVSAPVYQRNRDQRHSAASQQKRSFGNSELPLASSRSRGYRRVYSGGLDAGIQKKRSIRKRHFAKAAGSPDTEKIIKNSRVTWREALTSPRKSITYMGQLRRDLFNWCKHMWAGAKLLATDVRGSTRIMKKFQDHMKEEENMKRRLKGRLELAKYLRDVVEEKAKTIKASDVHSELKKDAEDLTDFLDAIRRGKEVQADEVARLSRFFVDELTIDGAVRPQLVAMCKYMGLSPYGHDLFLRFKLRSRINAIKKDDMEIMWEGGPGSLTDEEVGKACRDRGIREGESMQVMRAQLADWLDLSQKKEIPSSLLILSRAFLYTRADGTVETGSESLVEALGSLPEDVIMDVKQAADVSDGTTVERLKESIRQAKLIAMESDAEARKEEEDEVRRKKKETEEEAEAIESQYQANGKTPFVPDDSISDREVMDTVQRQEKKLSEEVLGLDREVSDADMAARASVQSDGGQDVEPKDEEEVQKERDGIRRMLLSLGELASDSAVESEREELRSLKVELSEAETAVKGTGGEESADLRRFKSIVSKLEKEIERVDNKVGLRMKLLDQDNDGLMSLEECANVMGMIAGERDDALVAETMHRLDANSDGNISKADLERVLNEMQYEGALPESKQVPSTSNGAETLKTKQATD